MSNSQFSNLYGLIGYPVKHSLSPAMHNAAFKAAGIRAQYRLFEIIPEELEDFLLNPDKKVRDTEGDTHRAGDIRGFNITIPHKVKTREILMRHGCKDSPHTHKYDILHRDISGAVNTVRRDDEGLSCFNTDAWGFIKSLKEDLRFSYAGKTVLIIGCGGAGRAIVAGLSAEADTVKKIYIYDTNHTQVVSAEKQFARFSKVRQLCEFVNYDVLKDVISRCQLLVNASPLGMKEQDEAPIDETWLHKDLSVYDVVYTRETRLIRCARQKGLPAADGRGMLAYQGARAWSLWTHEPEPCKLMREVLEKELS